VITLIALLGMVLTASAGAKKNPSKMDLAIENTVLQQEVDDLKEKHLLLNKAYKQKVLVDDITIISDVMFMSMPAMNAETLTHCVTLSWENVKTDEHEDQYPGKSLMACMEKISMGDQVLARELMERSFFKVSPIPTVHLESGRK